MEVIGGLSAIVTLIELTAKLSRSLIELSSKFKDSQRQFDALAIEIKVLGNVLIQLHRLHTIGGFDVESIDIVDSILKQCEELFLQLDGFRKSLSSNSGKPINKLNLRAKSKFVFNSSELEYLRARLESMKLNLLLMMSAQLAHQAIT